MRSLSDRARTLSPLTRALLGLAFINIVVVNLVLLVLPSTDHREITLYHTGLFLSFKSSWDSWLPMSYAWDYLQTASPADVYHHVWFDQGQKFQYPLTSLFPMEIEHLLLPSQPIRYAPLTLVSWFGVWGTALISALIFRDACREHLGSGPFAATSTTDERVRMALVVVLTITFYPVVKAFSVGQIQPWINFSFTAMVYLWMGRREASAGVMAGLICIIKPQLALLLIWALLRGRWRFAGALLAVTCVAFLASVGIYGLQQNLNYLSFLSYISRHGEAYFINHSVNGLMNRLLQNGDNLGLEEPAFPPFRMLVYVPTMVSTLLLVAFAMFWRRSEHAGASVIDLLIAGSTFTMASPIAWDHHYGILVPVFAVLVPAMLRWRVFGAATLVYLGVTYALCSNIFYLTRYTADSPLNVVQSYLLFAAFGVLCALYRVRRACAEQPAVETAVASERRRLGASVQAVPVPR